MKRKILFFSTLLAAISVLATSILVIIATYRDFSSTIKKEVIVQTSYVQSAVDIAGIDCLKNIKEQANHRLTIIAPDGSVLFDSVSDTLKMDNHLLRPEVQQALITGSGENTRFSDTIHQQTFYYATVLQDGNILRVSSPIGSAAASFDNLFWLIILIAATTIVIAGIIASFFTNRIIKPINHIDLEHPEQNLVYEELSPLLNKLKKQHKQILQQMDTLDRQRTEFIAITENMNEGFLVIDKDANILSYNKSALSLLDAPKKNLSGKSFLQVNRNEIFQNIVLSALNGTSKEHVMEIMGIYCQVLANPVIIDNEIQGAVIVLMDVTEGQRREFLRREFSANVSHELKTPLTSISGYAEIISNGLAKQEDIPAFSTSIYEEAQRLIVLIQDLMLLSKLDEQNISLDKEAIELLSLAKKAALSLKHKADGKNISISVSGDAAKILGFSSIMYEMIFNLLDNSIKYNTNNGKSLILIKDTDNAIVFSITDTGMGIHKSEQERIFERFYRVDKSHNSNIPGTGLGLAIVKHAALLHNAKITLDSIPGSGSTFSIFFPKSI